MPSQQRQTQIPAPKAIKPHKGPAMEGMIARWYTKIRQNDSALEGDARRIAARVPAGSQILEVAPGPGTLSIRLAQLGSYQIVGLDISATFVEIARANAQAVGVAVAFQQGNASQLPLGSGRFDFVVCRAAFKNFSEPVKAIQEMHRVLKPGGTALIIDLRGDASRADIETEVGGMGLNAINRALTRWTFKHFLLKNAYTEAQIQQLAAQTAFKQAEINKDAIGMEIWLRK